VQKNCFAAEDVEIERKISLVREQRLAQFYDIKGGEEGSPTNPP
jgi:hypothetical protein